MSQHISLCYYLLFYTIIMDILLQQSSHVDHFKMNSSSDTGVTPPKVSKTNVSNDVLSSPSALRVVKNPSRSSIEDSSNVRTSWSDLPHVALVNIFSHLEEEQRLEIQFVCKRWYDVVRHTGSLWRSKSFRFSGRDPRDLTHGPYRYATHYMRTFGRYIQKLEFRLYSPISSGVCKKFQKSVKVSFNHMIKNKSRLIQLSLPLLQLDRAQWMLYREDMCNSLARFFCQGQKTLQRVYLRGARANTDDGYKVLYAMGYNTGSTITDLDLEDFFNSRRPVYEITQFVDCFKNLTQLQELDINYSYLSETLLDTLSACLSPHSLKYLYIKVCAHEDREQVVHGSAWQRLTDQCPELKVAMLFQRVMTFVEHFRILSPYIPLSQVTFDGCYFADRDWQICPTITSVLPNFNKTLQRLYIDIPDTREMFEHELLSLVQQCGKLHHLKINAFISTRFLRNLLQSRAEGRCVFKTLKMRIYVQDYDTSNEDREVESIFNQYKQLVTSELDDYYAVCCVSI